MTTENENQEVQDEGEDSQQEQLEKDARAMGWRPEDEWDGPSGKWIDAKTFIEKGEHIMPILRANNKKMREELLTRDKETSKLKESLEAANKAIAALRKGYDQATKREVELALADLRAQFKQAREVGDVDLELDIQGNIDKLTKKAEKIGEEEEPEKKEGAKSPELDPEFLQWQSQNSWFGDSSNEDNKRRSDALLAIGAKLRSEGERSVGIPFMDKCMALLEEQEKSATKGAKSKVEGGGGRRVGGGGRAWDSLPKEAKDACHEDNDRFVGEGKMFKTVKEWEDHFTSLYSQ